MSAPLIGLTATRKTSKTHFPDNLLSESYIQAVQAAGGVPVLIPVGLTEPQWTILVDRLDGNLITGGGDIDPALFNGRSHQRVYDIDGGRDGLEIGLVRLAAARHVPFFGICRGIQVINVAFGGTLFTDIGDQLPGALRHDWYPDIPRDTLAHPVSVAAGSRLAGILGSTSAQVNSLHHQGLEDVPLALTVTAHAPDGLVEAVELPDHPFGIGVQWHPEWLQAHDEMRKLFRSFVEAAASKK